MNDSIELQEYLAAGSENHVYTEAQNGLPGSPRSVIRVPKDAWWQTPGAAYAAGSLEAMRASGIPISPEAEVVLAPNVIYPDGSVATPKFVTRAPYIEDVASKRLFFEDLCNPETATRLIPALIEILEANSKMLQDHQRGIDPFGLALVKDGLLGIGHRLVDDVCLGPNVVSQSIRGKLLPYADCAVNNLVKTPEGGLELIDYGAHDMSHRGFRIHRPLIAFAQHIGVAGLIEMMRAAKKTSRHSQYEADEFANDLYRRFYHGDPITRISANLNFRALQPYLMQQ